MKHSALRLACLVLALVTLLTVALTGCSDNRKKITIYTSSEDFRIEYFQQRMQEQFPEYNVVFEYKTSGDHAAVLKASGKNAECDISYEIEYAYAQELADLGVFADLTDYADFSGYVEDAVPSKYYLPALRCGGGIIINKTKMSELGLDTPTCYEDLLDPQYKDQISMPNPKSSGTGYIYLLSLVNAWGEEAALDYFDKLSENVLSFTSSGSGPVNAVATGEVAIGLGLTSLAVNKINDSAADLEVLFFEEGSPYTLYGMGVIAGKETDEDVMKVFNFLANELTVENSERYHPEQIFKDKTFSISNFPANITYCDMSNNTPTRKTELLDKWKH